MQYLTFTMDHDVGSPTGQSRFSNVRVYEAPAAANVEIISTARTTAVVGQAYIYDALNNDNTIEATGMPAPTFSRSSGVTDFLVSATGIVTWTPAVTGSFPIEITATNGTSPDDTQSFTVAVSEADSMLDFNSDIPASYGVSQDNAGTVTVEGGGSTLYLVGNRWQQIAYPYVVTSNTVLEFDFQSDAEGEVHGIGLDDNLSAFDQQRIFKVYGTQVWGILDFDDYPGDGSTKHYVIPVGQFYTGSMQYLTFTMDHDVGSPTGQSRFSNVRVYEAPAAANVEIISTARTTAVVGQAYIYDALNNDNTIEATGMPAPTFSRSSGVTDFLVSATGIVTWTPAVTGSFPIEITATNGTSPDDTQSFTVAVSEADSMLDFNSDIPASYGVGQDSAGTVTVEGGGSSALPGGESLAANSLSLCCYFEYRSGV